jgi:hypothetical protein
MDQCLMMFFFLQNEEIFVSVMDEDHEEWDWQGSQVLATPEEALRPSNLVETAIVNFEASPFQDIVVSGNSAPIRKPLSGTSINIGLHHNKDSPPTWSDTPAFRNNPFLKAIQSRKNIQLQAEGYVVDENRNRGCQVATDEPEVDTISSGQPSLRASSPRVRTPVTSRPTLSPRIKRRRNSDPKNEHDDVVQMFNSLANAIEPKNAVPTSQGS